MALLFVFIFGLVVGSFLNVLILRFNTGESAVKGKSKCFHCGIYLRWYELIPVLSFLIQKGRCRSCSAKISSQYILVEVLTAFVFSLIYLKLAGSFEDLFFYFYSPVFDFNKLILNAAIFNAALLDFKNLFLIFSAWIFFSCLIVIAVYDARHKIIPNSYSYFLTVFSLIYSFFAAYLFYNINYFFYAILSGVFFSVFFLFLSFISGEKWMGYGDGKLAFSLGIFLGPAKTLIAFMFSFWLGALFGIFILIFGRRFSLKSQIPFAPFLVLGAFLAFLIELDFIYLLLV